MDQDNDKFERLIEEHLQDKLDAARNLVEFKSICTSDTQKAVINEIIASLTRTTPEMWESGSKAQTLARLNLVKIRRKNAGTEPNA